MDLDLLITELDVTTIQLDKMRYLATQISNKASEKTQRAKNAFEYDFESREIFKCSAILLDYIEVVDNAIKKSVTKLAEYDTKLRKENAKALSDDSDKVDFGVTTDLSRNN